MGARILPRAIGVQLSSGRVWAQREEAGTATEIVQSHQNVFLGKVLDGMDGQALVEMNVCIWGSGWGVSGEEACGTRRSRACALLREKGRA